MSTQILDRNQCQAPWEHDHLFDQHHMRPGEHRTLMVVLLTLLTMGVEIAAGSVFGSMALMADGLHMASHALALSISVFAYGFARRHAADARFSFGTGKVNFLAGYTGAILLLGFAFVMAWESVARLLNPIEIHFDAAIAVAGIGLAVNVASMLILNGDSHHHPNMNGDSHHHSHSESDYNLKSAYLHVVADALTSFLAIFALLAAKFFAMTWMDPLMGIVGTILVVRWSISLLQDTSSILLDHQAADNLRESIHQSIESDNCRLVDLHLWSIGPDIYAAELTIVSPDPSTPDEYKELIHSDLGIVHSTIEVHCAPVDSNLLKT